MPDSLLISKISEIKGLQDSTLNKLNHINEVVNNLKNESLFLKLLPLIGVIIGGLITWWIQKSLKNKELKLATFRELNNASNKIITSLINLQFHLKELAYLEVDSKYQYYLSQTTTGDESKRALEEHYNDYKYISDYKNKVSTCVGDAFSNFSTYFQLKKLAMPISTSNSLLEFTNHILTLQREKEFSLTPEVTSKNLYDKIELLTNEYTRNINKILNLATALKS